MKNLSSISKYLKLLGNVLVIISIIFLVRRFFNYDIPLEKFYSKSCIISLILAVVVQTFLLICAFYPWCVFIEILSDIKLPIIQTIKVFVTSNIYKYLPGNVFHLIGRNQLAYSMKISHFTVVCATFIDLFLSILFTFLVAVILLREEIIGLLDRFIILKFSDKYTVILFLILIVLIVFYYLLYKKIIKYSYFLKKIFKFRNILKLFYVIIYYCLSVLVYSLLYFICLKLIIGPTVLFDNLLRLTGAFSFSWVVGTVTPGAPAGVGIREAVMLYITAPSFKEEILVFIILMRIATSFADICAFLVGEFLFSKLLKK